MGWIVFALLAVTVAWTLSRTASRALWPALGAALALGGAGYALQNHAALPGRPVVADRTPVAVPAEEVALRDAMLGAYSGDHAFLVLSNGLFRAGRTDTGTSVLLRAVASYPRSLTLWTGLGSAIARHDGGTVSPAAKLAFARAAQLAPEHPAPAFLAGLAYVRAGDLAAARLQWVRALALTPRGAAYRRDIEVRLALLDRFMAETAGMTPM